MAQAPPAHKTPLDVLTNTGIIREPFVNQFWGPALFGTFTFIGVCVSNWYIRRPPFSGIQTHLVLSGLAAVAGKYIDDYRAGYLAERDAVLRHYIQLHPEDFPPFDRKKYADVLESWVPIR